jgi:hypothetical protein
MARRRDIGRALGRVDGNRDRMRAVMRRYAGRHALARLDRQGKGGLVPAGILGAHQRQAQRVDPLARQRQADQPAAVHRHEIHRLRGGHLRRDHQIALVLAVLVIDKDEHAPVARILNDLLDRGDRVLPVVFHRSRGLEGHGTLPLT